MAMKSSMLLLAAVASLSITLGAAAGTDGTYVMDGGAYSINVEFVAEGVRVVEPNKTSLYTSTRGGDFEFTNPTNGINYGIRVIDDETIEAYKPGSSQAGTVLKLSGGSSFEIDEADPSYAKYKELADKYAGLTESDPDNVHVWAACGAAALAWAHMPVDQARSMAGQSAQLLRSIMTDATGTPCSDVIPADVW
jgi:hypothetical protein